MKLVMAIVPWHDKYLLSKAIELCKPGMEELTALVPVEASYYKLCLSLQAGSRELIVAFVDDKETPPEQEQYIALQKMIGIPKDYAGFYITELQENSVHILMAFIIPQYRTGELIPQGFQNIMKKTKLIGAPYLTLCTKEKALAEKLGFTEVYTKYQLKV